MAYEVGEATCIKETDKAILVVIGTREVWIPKSQIHDDSEVKEPDDEGTLVVSDWFGRKEGL